MALMPGLVRGQEPSALQVAAAMEDVLAEAIARAERSVVAIARVEKTPSNEILNLEFRPDPLFSPVMPIAVLPGAFARWIPKLLRQACRHHHRQAQQNNQPRNSREHQPE